MQYQFEKPIHGIISNEKYQCTVEWRNGSFISDEPEVLGGKDTAPDPFTLLLSSLVICTLNTIRMYVDRKGWSMPQIEVNANMYQKIKDGKTITVIDRDIFFLSEVDKEQKKRLVEIAKLCPISKILEGDINVRTFYFEDHETEKKINYTNNEITVVWQPELCQHSERCWSQLPEVFDYKKRPWINPQGALSQEIIEQIKKCPSGALSYKFNH